MAASLHQTVNKALEGLFPPAYLRVCECLRWHSEQGVFDHITEFSRWQTNAHTFPYTQICFCKFSQVSYQHRVGYWHPLQWLHIINMNHKANRSKAAAAWFIICRLKNTASMIWCQSTILLLPWQPVTQDAPHATPLPAASTITHMHSQTHYWWVFGSRFFLQQDLKSCCAPHKNRLGDKGLSLFFLFFLFNNPRSLDFSVAVSALNVVVDRLLRKFNKNCPFYNRWCHCYPSLANCRFIWVVFRVDLLNSVEPRLQFIHPHL